MARNWNGGTDDIHYVIAGAPNNLGCVSLWMKSTQATANVHLAAKWNSSSRKGWGLILNGTANKITALGYATSTNTVNITCTTSVNDGNWHHVAFNYNRSNGGANALYINGASEATANSSASWAEASSGFFLALGHPQSFWAAYVGDMAEVAEWQGFNLSADEIAALAKGFTPRAVRPNGLNYAPLVRDWRRIANDYDASDSITGTTVSDHPRVIGGAV